MVQNMQLFELSREPGDGCFGQTVRVGFSHPFIYLFIFPLAQVTRHHRVPRVSGLPREAPCPGGMDWGGGGGMEFLWEVVTRGQISM